METNTVANRAGADGHWDLVAKKLLERLDELRWDGKRKTLPTLLGGINEHSARRLVEGAPYNHAAPMRRAASIAVGWAPDAIDRLALGDESAAEVVAPLPDAPWAGAVDAFRSGGAPDDVRHDLAADAHARLRGEEVTLLELLQAELRRRGIRPELPGPDEPEYDLAWTDSSGQRHLAEAKVVGPRSTHLWEAMGQLLVYRTQVGNDVQGWAFIEREPTLEEREQLADYDLRILWPGELADDRWWQDPRQR